jgi:hypothetical protein
VPAADHRLTWRDSPSVRRGDPLGVFGMLGATAKVKPRTLPDPLALPGRGTAGRDDRQGEFDRQAKKWRFFFPGVHLRVRDSSEVVVSCGDWARRCTTENTEICALCALCGEILRALADRARRAKSSLTARPASRKRNRRGSPRGMTSLDVENSQFPTFSGSELAIPALTWRPRNAGRLHPS